MMRRVGACSKCGGDVLGFRGEWRANDPMPRDLCGRCGNTQ